MLGSSQSLVLATAMAVSTTAIILAFSRHNKSDPPPPSPPPAKQQQPLRSCLSTPESKKRRAKKKVKFADNVVVKENKQRSERSCRSEIDDHGIMTMMMPPNRVALYNGILKDRSHQRLLLGCSH